MEGLETKEKESTCGSERGAEKSEGAEGGSSARNEREEKEREGTKGSRRVGKEEGHY